MLYFRKNDLLDQAFDRYLVSAEHTLEKSHIIGDEIYQNHINFMSKSLQRLYRIIDKEDFLYRKYKKVQNKYETKIIKLEFSPLSSELVATFSYFKRKSYLKKKKKQERFEKKLFNLDLKYRLIISDVEYEPDNDEDLGEIEEERLVGAKEEPETSDMESASTQASEDNDVINDVDTKDESKTSSQLFDEIFGLPKPLNSHNNESEEYSDNDEE